MDAALIDDSRLAGLAGALGGDVAAADRFVADFVTAWPERWDRVWSAVRSADTVELRAVLLSIRSSSSMLGAPALAQLATDLLTELERYGAVHPDAVARLLETGTAVCRALGERVRDEAPKDQISSPVSR